MTSMSTQITTDSARVFVEIRGEDVPADLLSLATLGECSGCVGGTCVIFPAYLRISDDKMAVDVDTRSALATDRGVVRQAPKLVELAQEHGATHVILFVDNDLSASTERKAKALWWAVIGYVKANRPKWLYALKADRLGRRLSDMELLDDLRVETGTRVWTLAEGDLFANAAWPFMAAMAKVEARQISWRLRQAQDSRRAKGLDTGGGNRPYGYAVDRLTVIPAEAEIIREAARRLVERETASAICRSLNERGVPRPSGGKTWTPVVLRGILSRPRYCDSGNGKGLRVRNVGDRQNNWRYEIVGPAAWPAILDRPTWELVQERLNATSTKRRGRPVASLLGGLARCAYCETVLHSARDGRGQRTYRCRKDIGGCGKVNRLADAIDAYVSGRALDMLSVDVDTTEADELRAQADRLAEESAGTELRIAALREHYAAGTVADEDYFATLDTLRKKVRGLDKEHAATVIKLDAVLSDQSIRDRWENMSTDQRRAFLKRRTAAVMIYTAAKPGVIGEGEIEIR